VRIVAATAKDLAKEVNEGRFREDLFYRLNVLPIHIPPLRERKEDIPLLIHHFIKKYNQIINKNVVGIDQKALEALMRYKWFGNVRELENAIERAVVLSDKDHLEIENFPIEVQDFKEELQLEALSDEECSIKKASKALEINLIKRALKKTRGNHTHAARLLEISHRALLYKIKDYGITENGL
jgi:two-component system response regulator AtoC